VSLFKYLFVDNKEHLESQFKSIPVILPANIPELAEIRANLQEAIPNLSEELKHYIYRYSNEFPLVYLFFVVERCVLTEHKKHTTR